MNVQYNNLLPSPPSSIPIFSDPTDQPLLFSAARYQLLRSISKLFIHSNFGTLRFLTSPLRIHLSFARRPLLFYRKVSKENETTITSTKTDPGSKALLPDSDSLSCSL